MLTVKLVQKMLAGFLAIFLSLGWISYPSTDEPFSFKDSENVKMSFVAIADTHTMGDSFTAFKLSNMFKDIENSGEKVDAVVVAGDLTELGLPCEYDEFFDVFDNETVVPVRLLALGNHDARMNYKNNKKRVMSKVEEYLNIDTQGKSYYSYDVNGYTFIVMGTDKQVFEKAYISNEQLSFLDSELARATKDQKPVFVINHQPLEDTHGLPEVWATGGLGEQTEQVRAILTKYKNVFYINGHLHDGIYERSFETLSEGVYTVNLPTYRKANDYGISDKGTGYVVEVYDEQVVFTARNFKDGKKVDTEKHNAGEYVIDLVK